MLRVSSHMNQTSAKRTDGESEMKYTRGIPISGGLLRNFTPALYSDPGLQGNVLQPIHTSAIIF